MKTLTDDLQAGGNLPCEKGQVGDVHGDVGSTCGVVALGHQGDHGSRASPQADDGCTSVQVGAREQLSCGREGTACCRSPCIFNQVVLRQ